ncbi:MAG: nucleotidyltransferase family protein [Spirochaetales bacterium]|nr:nucleotidyltransferase family protein [Spirochaetales bacterium]
MSSRRAEDELLLLLLFRPTLSPSVLTRCRSMLTDSLDWTYLADRAREQLVYPPFYRNLLVAGPRLIPERLRGELEQEFRGSVLQNLLLTRELFRVLDLFEAARISVIPYKGPVWASSFYEDIANRTFFDLDLLVDKSDVLEAKRLLLAQGYQPEQRLNHLQEAWKLRFDCEYQFDHPDTGIHVEVHWRFVPGYLRFKLPMRGVWRRAGTALLGGRELPTLSTADALSVLCIHHGGKHGWAELRGVVDLDRLAGMAHGFDWAAFVEQARKQGILRLLCSGFSLAQRLLGTPVPREVATLVDADRVVQSLVAQICARMLQSDQDPMSGLHHLFLHLRLRERWIDRLRYLPMVLYDILRPTDKERALVKLPPALSFLYVPIRPLRLLVKYGPVLFRALSRKLFPPR